MYTGKGLVGQQICNHRIWRWGQGTTIVAPKTGPYVKVKIRTKEKESPKREEGDSKRIQGQSDLGDGADLNSRSSG